MDMMAYFLGRVATQSSGVGGTEYTNIEYNEDDTITLTDKDGIDHKMVCTYDDTGKLIGATYDGKVVELTYKDDNLVSVGETTVKLESATFETYSAILYSHFGVNKDVYKYLFINQVFNGAFYTATIDIYFSQNYNVVSEKLQPLNSLKASVSTNYDFPVNVNNVVAELINKATTDNLISSASEWTSSTGSNITGYLYTNQSIESTKYSSITSLDEYGENVGQQPFQNGFALGLSSGGVVVKKDIAKSTLTVSPNLRGTANIEPSGTTIISIDGLSASIVGEGKVGETLSVSSDSINLDMCDFQWLSECVKYSHTPNIDDTGVQNGNYENSYNNTEVITIEGVESLPITIKYETEPNCDYITVFVGNHPDYTYSTAGYLKRYSGSGEETFTVEGDSVTFAFRSDISGTKYGYYAKIGDSQVIEGATNKEYTVQNGDAFISCRLYGKDEYYGTSTTETISIKG